MLSNILKKSNKSSNYEIDDFKKDIKIIAGLIVGNIPNNIKDINKETLISGVESFIKRIKVCEKKHDINEIEEFNVSKKEDQKIYAVVNIEDIFIHLNRYLNSTFFTNSNIDDNLNLVLFRIYKHFLDMKRKEILEKNIKYKYFDCFYNDPYIKYKFMDLSNKNKISDPEYSKYNKVVQNKGIKELKENFKSIFIEYTKKNMNTEVISNIEGNDIVAFSSLIQDFIPRINEEYVFNGKTTGTNKDKIDFSDCTTNRFFFITEYQVSSGNNGVKASNAIIWTNFENIINRFGLNGVLVTKFANVINKYEKPNLIKDLYIINNNDFSKIIPILQQAHQRIINWENPALGESENKLMGGDQFESSELFEEFKNDIILTAIRSKVTDIHIKESGGKGMINFRSDNKTIKTKKIITKDKLQRYYRILIEKSNLDNTGSFPEPQDGKLAGPDMIIIDPINQLTYNVEARINLGQGGNKIYIRLTGNSMNPVGYNKEQKIKSLKELGYLQKDIDEIYRITTVSPNGLILVTGATGQGKTTLLFTLLNDLLIVRPEVHMLTIEDPVEMKIDLFNVEQNELKDKDQYPIFIKAFLRQDPDWIMVGETRDSNTLFYLKEASLTGHLCFSTFHANDTISTLNRLINLLTTDVSQRKLALLEILTFIKGIVSQKLVPKLCNDCKIEEEASNILKLLRQKGYNEEKIKGYLIENKKNNVVYYKRNHEGCTKCEYSGNKGRQVLVEILSFINPNVSEYIKSDKSPEIEKLFDKGLIYVANGTMDLNTLIGEV